MMTERTDPEWVRLLKQDDPQAIHDLWELLSQCGRALARRYSQDEEVGHDAATEAYLRMRRYGLNTFRFESSFRTYCWRIVANEVLRFLSRRRPTTVELDEELMGEEDAVPPVDPKEIRARLQPCLDRLEPRERHIVESVYIKEHTPQMLAENLGISRNYVNVLAWRARRKLRDCLQGQGYLGVADMV